MEEGIRKAEGADCASLLNVGAWSRPPPTEPVVCMNYSSICDKQLGNYYRDHLIKSDCENADGNKVFPEVLGTSSFFLMLLVIYAVFLIPPVSLCPGLLHSPSFVSLSRTFIKGGLVVVEAARPSLHSSVFVLLLARSDRFRVVKFTPSVRPDLYIVLFM